MINTIELLQEYVNRWQRATISPDLMKQMLDENLKLIRLKEADERLDAALFKYKLAVEKRRFGNRAQLQENVDQARRDRAAALEALK